MARSNYKTTSNSTLSSILSKNETQELHITNISNGLPLLLSIDAFNTHIGSLSSTFGTIFDTNNTQNDNVIYKIILLHCFDKLKF